MKSFPLAALAAVVFCVCGCASTSSGSSAHARRAPIAWDGSVMTAIEVDDLAAAKKWYAETLGFEVCYDLPEQGWCEVASPLDGATIGMSMTAPGSPPRGSAGAAISFGVKDIAAAREWLVKCGVEVPEIFEIPEIVKLLEFTDPFGNRLMLYQEPAH